MISAVLPVEEIVIITMKAKGLQRKQDYMFFFLM